MTDQKTDAGSVPPKERDKDRDKNGQLDRDKGWRH